MPQYMQAAVNIVDNLGHDSCPVYGIDSAKMIFLFEVDVVKYPFDNGLSVIKSAANGHIVHVGIEHRGQHQSVIGVHCQGDVVVPMQNQFVAIQRGTDPTTASISFELGTNTLVPVESSSTAVG